jgi:stage II sporulation protein E
MVLHGDIKAARLAKICSQTLDIPLCISDKLQLSADKACYILRSPPRFDACFGIASKVKDGETISGDTHSVIKIDEKRFMLALSDGMGSGEYAHKVSESTISLLESFYRANLPSDVILTTINRLLAFNSKETFACLDIGTVNLDTGMADIIKIGSPHGFIISEGKIRVLESSTLPLGILDNLRPATCSYALEEGDMLVFISDGIAAAFGSSSDIFDYLKNVPALNPQAFADGLLAEALARCGNVAKDDMTALAVRLFQSNKM